MRGIKISKIAALWLLMVLMVGFGRATKELPPLERNIDGAMMIIGGVPKVGESFEIVYRIKIKETQDWKLREDDLTRDYVAIIRCAPPEAVEILGEDKFFFSGLPIGRTIEFRTRCRILKPVSWIYIDGDIDLAVQGKSLGPVATSGDATLWLIDTETGQYGTREEYERGLSVEYRYDFVDGSFIGRYDQSRVSLAENRRIIKMMKELEPSLTDSLALLLHSEQYKVGVPKGTAKWDSLNQRWIDKGVYEYYLKDGWLKAVQDGRLMEWEENEKMKIQKEWKGGKGFNFFRIDNNTPPDLHGGDRLTKTFDGYWKFKDHLYNKDQGLLADAIKKPVKNARARIYITYQISGVPYRYVSEQCITNENGYFSITTELPNSFELGKAFAVVYPAGGGPDTASPVINVSDPNPHQPSYKRDPLDPTLYVILNLYYKEFYPNSLLVHFDTVYADTYPAVGQPESGCLNIYETYLHARTFMSPPPGWPLRVMWEPGYDSATAYRNDTIWVIGEPSVPIEDTDEWDDDVLLHEFGHYLMDNYAEIPPNLNPNHRWYLSDSVYKNTAYTEGWPTFFSGRTRVNSGTDSLYVDNKKIGSGSALLWRNIENPWLGSGFDTLQFQGGPWCEGAVAGALWDIYDSHNESPYHSYPSLPQFPDTGLYDTLTMGFNPIWDVFDNYNPPGEPTNCWTIFHFRSGWNALNYDHAYAVNEILLHHRIRDSIPAKPIGLSAAQVGNAVRLYWRKNLEFDLQGYRIYRRSKKEFVIPPQPWGSWVFLADKGSPNDTTHLDQAVQLGWRYRYKVTAYDSLGNESEYSDSVEIFVQFGINPDDIEMFSFCVPPLIVMKGDLKICYSSVVNNQKVILKLYDICGRLVHKQDIVLKKGIDNEFVFSSKNLSSGVYFVQIQTKDYNKIQKVVIVR
ncbi:MAG: T9SS type A sorting domain-containing protein [candidate division WOR-3 bacterium]